MRWPFSRKQSLELSPEVEEVFQKIDRLLTNEQEQNLRYPVELQNRILGNSAVDMVPNASGAFGITPTNSIPVNGVLGELIYLSCLHADTAEGIVFHRLGSIDEVDIYEIMSTESSRWDLLFMDMYYPRKSVRAPDRYILRNRDRSRMRFLRGTNERLSEFPRNLFSAVREASNDLFGMPIFADPMLQDVESAALILRPAEHQKKIEKIEWLLSGNCQLILEDYERLRTGAGQRETTPKHVERVRFQWSTMTDTENRGDIYALFESHSNGSVVVTCENLPNFVAHYSSLAEAQRRSPYDLSEHIGKLVGGLCMVATPDEYGE